MMVIASRTRRNISSDSCGVDVLVTWSKKGPTTSARPTAQHAAAFSMLITRTFRSIGVEGVNNKFRRTYNKSVAIALKFWSQGAQPRIEA